ncbi:hypothetical protein BH10ACT7_BH10ACT7_28730 [soil metagenome]
MRRASIAFVVAGLLALTGCTVPMQPKPTVVDTPAILWQVAPSSPLESNKYVQALRAADIGRALAVNLRDFSILQYTNTRPAREGVEGYESYLRTVFGIDNDRSEPFVLLGPAQWEPLAVTPNAGDNGATIQACFNGAPTFSSEGRSGVAEVGYLWSFTVTTDLESGVLVTAGESSGSDKECDSSTIPVGRFSPVPMLPVDPNTGDQIRLTPDDVIAPPWWEDRCFTGWSKAGCNRGEDAR